MNLFFFGDSIAEGFWDKEGGWVERLRKDVFQKTIDSDYRVFHRFYNLGVSGDNTDTLKNRFRQEISARTQGERREDNLIIIAIGINDSQVYQESGETRVPFKKFQENILLLFSQAEHYAEKMVCLGLTPVDESKVNPSPWTPEKSYKNSSVQKFNNFLQKICNQKHITFVDVFSEWMKKDYLLLLSDGLHPNTQGHALLYNLLKPHIAFL